jgi:hypothetical protein
LAAYSEAGRTAVNHNLSTRERFAAVRRSFNMNFRCGAFGSLDFYRAIDPGYLDSGAGGQLDSLANLLARVAGLAVGYHWKFLQDRRF